MWKSTYVALTSPPSQLAAPLGYDYHYYILIEALGGAVNSDGAHFSEALEVAMDKGLILDAAIANTANDINWFFNIREDVSILTAGPDHDQHFDISLAIADIGDYVESTLEELEKLDMVSRSFAFGHMADGNIHFLVMKRSADSQLKEAINQIVYKPLSKLSGSISAEHGIGLDKKAYLHLSRTPAEISIMKTLKRSLDPNNILNPGRIFEIN